MKKEPNWGKTPEIFSGLMTEHRYTEIAQFFLSLSDEIKRHTDSETRQLSARLSQAANDLHVTALNFTTAADIPRNTQ